MDSHLFLQTRDYLKQGTRIVLARIVRRVGSAPRAPGSSCIILEDGSIKGTIGGGLLEHLVQERAREIFSTGKTVVYPFQLTGKEVARSDMICGGLLDVYLEPVFPENREAADLFETVGARLGAGTRGILLTRIADGIGALSSGNRMAVMSDGFIRGNITGLDRSQIPLEKRVRPQMTEFPETGPIFIEPIEPDPVLFLFGAGHISTFVAPLAKMVGFRVTVIDDRPEFANRDRFPEADEILVITFQEAFSHLQIDGNAYIAIVTRGHQYDAMVLESAIKENPAYIGMISSRRKRDIVFRSLMESGVPKEKLDRVCSPIGIDIQAETPEEISVSIVAELIEKRAALAGKETHIHP